LFLFRDRCDDVAFEPPRSLPAQAPQCGQAKGSRHASCASARPRRTVPVSWPTPFPVSSR